jgi:hypothetical protein
MEEVIRRVVPPLLEEGGLIPSCDHDVPSDISWSNLIECARLLARLTGGLWTSGSAGTRIGGQGRPSLVCVSAGSSPVPGT